MARQNEPPRQRPQPDALLSFAREDDTVVVHSMYRLARNLDDLRRLVQTLTKRGIRIEFVKECLSLVCEDSPMANLLLAVMGRLAFCGIRACLDRRAATRRDRIGQTARRLSGP